ncbi:hypothetical protein M501DRAFT_1015743 [Patellaria atrata CBS 101060]|uniref:Uncharacterized protein n=1 Tax=Patellaria atrata CBS 101060 TaxID=1346257 RepID=A0A9P4SBK7_9PEZI|nr:hypothetical protein M501DRAFT_1015743 [Patellaria atrata CBS 101060]
MATTTRMFGMQSARLFNVRAARSVNLQFTRNINMQATRSMRMQPTRNLLRPVPKEEHSAHTISQRIRTLKKIPPELIPLGIVLAAAIAAAIFASIRKFYTDKTLRLTRQGPRDDH